MGERDKPRRARIEGVNQARARDGKRGGEGSVRLLAIILMRIRAEVRSYTRVSFRREREAERKIVIGHARTSRVFNMSARKLGRSRSVLFVLRKFALIFV